MKNEELPAAVLPRLRLGSRPLAARAPRRLGTAVRRAELRPAAGRGDRRRAAHLRPAAVAPQAGAAQPPDQPRPGQGPATDSSAVLYDDQGTPFSLTDYREMDRVTAEWQAPGGEGRRRSARRCRGLRGRLLPAGLLPGEGDRQPVRAAQRASSPTSSTPRRDAPPTNDLADRRRGPVRRGPGACPHYYNTTLAGGKWKGWQLQPHIDYGDVARYGPNAPWQQPELNNVALPDVIFPRRAADRRCRPRPRLGVGDRRLRRQWWPGATDAGRAAGLQPVPDAAGAVHRGVQPRHARRSRTPIRLGRAWVTRHRRRRAACDKQVRATVRVDWARAPEGHDRGADHRHRADGAARGGPGRGGEPGSAAQAARGLRGGERVRVDRGRPLHDRPSTPPGSAGKRIPGIGRTGDGMDALARSPRRAGRRAATARGWSTR